jgi:hypothetical protein
MEAWRFNTSALAGGEWSPSCSFRFTPEEGGAHTDYSEEGQRSGHESGVKNVRLAVNGCDTVSDLGTWLEGLRNHTIHCSDNRPRLKLEPLPIKYIHIHSMYSIRPSKHSGYNTCRLLEYESPSILSTECIYGLHAIL